MRGTIGKSPGQFKEVVVAAFGAPYARSMWGISVAKVAAQYREQFLLDFECFRDYVNENYLDLTLAAQSPAEASPATAD